MLLLADSELSDDDLKRLSQVLEQRHGKVTVIAVRANPRAVIVKTTNVVAPVLREASGETMLGGKRLVTVLTSGSIGKLKRRASRVEEDS